MRGYCLQCNRKRVIKSDGLCTDCRINNDEEKNFEERINPQTHHSDGQEKFYVN